MTKVYVVMVVDMTSENKIPCISEVFTNKKKANNYENYWNNVQKRFWYYVKNYDISQEDYGELPF